jgi:hypothetical protein
MTAAIQGLEKPYNRAKGDKIYSKGEREGCLN